MNNKKIIIALASLFLISQVFAQNQKQVSVTVYNSNLGVVKDVRDMNINSGISKIDLTDVAKLIDPTSVHIKLDGEVLEQNYQYDLVSLDKILKKYIDKDIKLIGENDELIEGRLLSSYGSQVVLANRNGGLIMLPNVNKYRFSVESLPEGLITKPTLVWMVNSNQSGSQEVEVTYQTGGMNWHAEYVALLNEDDTALDLNSWVSVENHSGTTYKNAKLKVVAGDVNRVQQGRGMYDDKIMVEMSMAKSAVAFEEKAFFEYHIYNLQRPTTIANNETKQISLFEVENVKSEKKFYYNSRNQGGTTTGKVSVIVEFENTEENGLGIPMPKGKVRVYKTDGEAVEFVGEDLIDHTTKKETVKLKIGEAFDIVVEETQTENRKITNKVYDRSWSITFKNRKDEDIIVDVERYLGNNWEVLNSSLDYNKKDAQNITFKVPIGADKESVLKFKVRYNY
jgi:hypothetical protein